LYSFQLYYRTLLKSKLYKPWNYC